MFPPKTVQILLRRRASTLASVMILRGDLLQQVKEKWNLPAFLCCFFNYLFFSLFRRLKADVIRVRISQRGLVLLSPPPALPKKTHKEKWLVALITSVSMLLWLFFFFLVSRSYETLIKLLPSSSSCSFILMAVRIQIVFNGNCSVFF